MYSISACCRLPTWQLQAIVPQVQVRCIDQAVRMLLFLSTCSRLATGLLVSRSRDVTLKRKSWTGKALPQKVHALMYRVRVFTEWSLGPCGLFANQKAYVLPSCNSMSVWINKSDFIFLLPSSVLISVWIQPGGSMKVMTLYRFVFQWHW